MPTNCSEKEAIFTLANLTGACTHAALSVTQDSWNQDTLQELLLPVLFFMTGVVRTWEEKLKSLYYLVKEMSN